MTYYPDLSSYAYADEGIGRLNVGWLSRSHEFPQGPVNADVVAQLILSAADFQNQMRGFHECEFCDRESPIRVEPPDGGKLIALGMSEIWVDADHGQRFSAPSLIIHYITEHGYSPPSEFQEAVLRSGVSS